MNPWLGGRITIERAFSGFDLGGIPGDADFNAQEDELVFFCHNCGKSFPAAS